MDNESVGVLVIDDEELSRLPVVEALTATGYDCCEASTGAEAEETLATQSFPLVILDVNLPDTTGLQLLPRIKECYRDTMVIMATGQEDLDTAVEAMKRGAEDYITKPVHVDRLRIAVHRSLEKRQLLVERREYQIGLESMVAKQTQEIRLQRDRIGRLLLDTVEALAASLEAKDRYTEGHCRRVTQYGLRLAQAMGLPYQELRDMELGGLLHDIGKIGVPDAVLTKEGKLTEEEFNSIRAHPVIGAEIVKRIAGISSIITNCVRSHHERWDGKGYPDGLKEEKIPIPGRILAVADAFDAMTSSRSYRPAMSVQDALRIVEENAGQQFDPNLTSLWLQLMNYHAGGGGNILVIDDDVIIRRILEDSLAPLGHRVVTASSGYQGLRRVQDEPFDIIYLDINMPGLDGANALAGIKRYRPDAFAVIITGTPEDARVLQMLEMGAEACLVKPLAPNQLVDLTKGLLEKRFGNRAIARAEESYY